MNRRFSLQELMVVVGVILLILAVSLPSMLKSRAQGGETSAIQGLRAIHSSEQIARRKETGFVTLGELATKAGLEQALAGGSRSGYDFRLTVSADGKSWGAVAAPKEWTVTGQRNFLISQDGVICYSPLENAAGAEGLLALPFFKSYKLSDLGREWRTLDGGALAAAGGAPGGDGGAPGGDPGGNPGGAPGGAPGGNPGGAPGGGGGGCSLGTP